MNLNLTNSFQVRVQVRVQKFLFFEFEFAALVLYMYNVIGSLAHRGSLDPDHILYGLLNGSSDTRQVRLRSRRPFVPAARNLLKTLPDLASALLNGQITNGKRSTVKMLPGSMLLCPGPVPGLLGWAYPEQFGLSSTACGLVLGDSIRPCTNGVSLLHRIASVAPLSKPQTMF